MLEAATADGRYVVFSTPATNLVSGNSSTWQEVYVRDRQTSTTTPVSVASTGALADCDSGGATISADGRYVAFWSCADNLYPGSTLGTNGIYVRDLVASATEREDVTNSGTPAGGFSSPKLSSDGRFVVFLSNASNLVTGATGTQA